MRLAADRFFDGYRSGFGGLTQEQVDGLNDLLAGISADQAVIDVRWAAYMLATVKHECADRYQPITEYGNEAYFRKYDGRADLGNVQAGDGYRYRGRGYVQLTGRANYRRMSDRLGLTGHNDLEASPERALDPAIAYRIMSYGMRSGSFTGRKLSSYISADACDYVQCRRIINALDRAEMIAGYATQFEGILGAALATATQVDPDLIDRAHALGLFAGKPDYYYAGGAAHDDERTAFVVKVVNAAISELEEGADAMSTQLHPNVIDRAHALELFSGSAAYYYPEGSASDEERDRLIDTVLRTAVERIEAARRTTG